MIKRHIILLGRRNTGKSSLINVLTSQHTAIVSDTAGTTTDPVRKSFEIPGVMTAVFIDTAGLDDEGELGEKRMEKTRQALLSADCAFVVFTHNNFGPEEKQIIRKLQTHDIPFILIHNKSDLLPLTPALRAKLKRQYRTEVLDFSTKGEDRPKILLQALQQKFPDNTPSSLLGDLLHPQDILLLIAPIDSEAPTGRLILPQVKTIRDILDNHAITIMLQPEEIPAFLSSVPVCPRLVITDSQVFRKVAGLLPESFPLTSFSILFARHQGDFHQFTAGTRQISSLQDHDRILILESCSHHTSCEDIGRVKLPALLQKYTQKQLEFDFRAGLDPIERPVTDYALVIQCGGCMITPTQLKNRLSPFIRAGIPVSNYGMALAFVNGIFERALQPFHAPVNPSF